MLFRPAMPSHAHEVIAEMLCESPALIAELLQLSLGVRLPAFATATRVDAKLTEVSLRDYHSDGLILFRDAEGVDVTVVVLEVQLRPDARKDWTWPAYVTLARARHECPADLVVVTVDEATARQARRRIRVGRANTFRAFVVGPGVVPRIDDAARATAHPELAVISALAHSRSVRDAGVVRAVLNGLAGAPLEGRRFAYYRDVIEQSLTAAVRKALEAEMPYPGYEPQSEFSKGIYRGLEEGEKKGIATGEKRGQILALRRAVMSVLKARGISLPDAQKARIDSCEDEVLLNAWIERAAVVATTEELFSSAS
jgi:hypothetical protein